MYLGAKIPLIINMSICLGIFFININRNKNPKVFPSGFYLLSLCQFFPPALAPLALLPEDFAPEVVFPEDFAPEGLLPEGLACVDPAGFTPELEGFVPGATEPLVVSL